MLHFLALIYALWKIYFCSINVFCCGAPWRETDEVDKLEMRFVAVPFAYSWFECRPLDPCCHLHTPASINKQYNSVLVEGRWCSESRKVTIGLLASLKACKMRWDEQPRLWFYRLWHLSMKRLTAKMDFNMSRHCLWWAVSVKLHLKWTNQRCIIVHCVCSFIGAHRFLTFFWFNLSRFQS